MNIILLIHIARFVARMAIPSMRTIRLATYSLFVFGALALAAGRSVYADAREVGLGLGHQLAKLEDLTDGAYLVRVNGAEVHWASVRTAQSVDEVLARYERYCRESPSALGEAMLDIPQALEDRVPLLKSDPARAGIVRDGAEGRGMVACFVDDQHANDAEGLRRKLDAFGRSGGDLSELGRFRYVFAERGRYGTRVVTLWSDGPLNLGKMFPSEGDAPGTDSAHAPRPAGSRRTMSASVDGFPAAVRIYESKQSPSEIVRAQGAALRAKGFEDVTPISQRSTSSTRTAAYIRSDGVEIVLSVSHVEPGPTSIAIVETGASSVRGVKVEK